MEKGQGKKRGMERGQGKWGGGMKRVQGKRRGEIERGQGERREGMRGDMERGEEGWREDREGGGMARQTTFCSSFCSKVKLILFIFCLTVWCSSQSFFCGEESAEVTHTRTERER